MRSYADRMIDFIQNNIFFTCQDIINITNTTCPHSVVRDLRKKCYISSEKKKTKEGKNYFLYKFEGPLNA